MRALYLLLVGSLALGGTSPAWADEGDGLSLQLPRLQGRVRLGMSTPVTGSAALGGSGPRMISASVLGDYYFDRQATRDGDASGFRATTGVFLGSRLGMWGGHAPAAVGGSFLSVERHSFSLVAPQFLGDNADSGTAPYVGLGYSGSSTKGGWGFSADLGLLALNAGNAVRLGRVFGGGQNLDDLLRELRFSPVLQLGVSYSF